MTVGNSATKASSALRAAQALLMALRAQRRDERRQQGLPLRTDANGRFLSPTPASAAPLPSLPPHLGWDSAAVTTAVRRSQPVAPASPPPAPVTGCSQVAAAAVAPPVPATPAPADVLIRLFPDLVLGMLRAKAESAGRIWLLLRHLDTDGQGWLPASRIRAALTGQRAALRVCGWRQLRNLLRAGEGIFWQRQRGRVWLRSVAKVAAALDVWRLHSRPVALPLSVLTQRMGQVRAHFYASFHSGRNRETAAAPIARVTLQTLTCVHPRTQRRYERQVRVRRHSNYALGNRVSADEIEEKAWQHGHAFFHFTDAAGRQGPAGTTYLAWQLPNHYEGPHQPQPRGRQQGINRELADLLKQGMTGNGKKTETPFRQQRFYRHGKDAVHALNRQLQQEAYWPAQQPHLWHCIEKPPDVGGRS